MGLYPVYSVLDELIPHPPEATLLCHVIQAIPISQGQRPDVLSPAGQWACDRTRFPSHSFYSFPLCAWIGLVFFYFLFFRAS